MNSRNLVVVELAIVLAAALAAAQTTGAQASGAASNQTSVSADRSGAQADSQTSVNAAGSTSKDGKQTGSAAASGNHSSSATVGKGSADLASGSTINAVLSKPVDARKNKPGDEVTAKVDQNVKTTVSGTSQVVIPKGSRLVGHVTEARAREKAQRSKDKEKSGSASASGRSDSALGIAFDKAILKNGQEIPLHAVIQAVAASQQQLNASTVPAGMTDSTSAADAGGATASRGREGGLIGGATSTVSTTTTEIGNTGTGVTRTIGGAVDSTAGVAGSATSGLGGTTTAGGQLTSSAHGVVGLQGLSLNSATAGSAQGSVITSSTRDVRLDSGTQMLLRVTGSAQ